MPYIAQEYRKGLDPAIEGLETMLYDCSPGELNYVITRLLIAICNGRGESYQTYNEIIGVLECVKQEFYRRAVASYEDQKAKENGDVY